MTDKIELGDIVILKSGGPEMTVDSIELHNGIEKVTCCWFSADGLQKGLFAFSSLKTQILRAARRPRLAVTAPQISPAARLASSR